MRAAAAAVAALLLPASAWAGGLYPTLPPGRLPPPVPWPATLLVGPQSSGQPIGCGGRDVVIDANGITVDLRGGCRSVTISGGRVSVRAELMPGALLRIGSPGVVINYALVGTGPPPVVRLTAPGLHASHLERLGQTALSLAVPTGVDLTSR